MNRTIFTLSTILVFSATGFSQTAEKAKQVLDQLSAKTKSFTTIYADFSFTMENLQEKIKEAHDGFIKVKGNKYMVSLMGSESYFDGKSLWTYMKEMDEVNVTDPDPNEDGNLNPAKIFTMYEKGFKYMYVGEKTENGKVLHEIDLFPENRDKAFSRIKLFVYKDNLQIHSFKQIGKDGNNYTVKVNKMVTNQPIPDTDFTFNKAAHPKAEIIDMR
ncbi:MAG: outer membrane lipoprotein carrier protein LolA [Breznakibacter sp.]